MTMRIGSLFSGAGCLDRAVAEVFGGETAWHSEIDPAAKLVLAHRFPSVLNLGDITQADWRTVEPVDILCGGFPCQDVSSAGRRAGIRNGTRSGLWALFADAVAALRPRFVVIENVRGLLSADGEEWPLEVAAADVEAQKWLRVHKLIQSKIRRAKRLGGWCGEYRKRKSFEAARVARLRDRSLARFRSMRKRLVQRAIGTVVADLADLGYDAQWTTVSASSVSAPHRRERVFILANPAEQSGWIDHGDGIRVGGAQGVPDGDNGRRPVSIEDVTRARGDGGASDLATVACLLPTPRKSDGDGGANPLSRAERMDDVETRIIRLDGQWGKYAPAIHRWETLTRTAPSPTEPNTKGNPRLAAQFSEWMMGWPAGWVTAVPGISRNDQLRIIGNGVVPQCAAAALRWLLTISEIGVAA